MMWCMYFLSDDSQVTKALVAQLLALNSRHREHVKMVGGSGGCRIGVICCICAAEEAGSRHTLPSGRHR